MRRHKRYELQEGAWATPPPGLAAPDEALVRDLNLRLTRDPRALVIKLADRLHNMRTLESLAEHKRKRIADETLAVFAPLAKLLGMYGVKDELEVRGASGCR